MVSYSSNSYSPACISGNSLSKFENESSSLTLNLTAGSFSHADKSDLALMRGPRSCLPHLKVIMRILHPENFTMPLEIVDEL